MLALALPREISIASSSRLSRTRIRQVIPVISARASCSCSSSAPSSTREPPRVFAYLSKRRSRPIIALAMSSPSTSLRRRHSTKPPSPPSPSHSHEHSHDHDHNHGGIFHSHTHDHSEGAEQIIKAFSSKGRLDRGTRITLLGQFA